MFDLPARFNHDEKYHAVRVKTRAQFRKAEERELQGLNYSEKDRLVFSELRGGDASDPLDRGYIGFVSQGIYNGVGELVGDTVTASLAELGRNQRPRRYDEHHSYLGFNSGAPKNTPGFSSTQQHAAVLQAGLELLPRSTAPPIVRSECGDTRRIIHAKSQELHPLSEKAQKVLERTNFSKDRSLSYNLRGDVWAMGRRMLRRRGMQVTASILWVSLDRGDYERAQRALGVLLRSDGIIMRNLWMPAVELLAWEQSRSDASNKSRTPTAFLDWLIVNFPSVPNSAALWRKIPRAERFRPLSIMSTLAKGDYKRAMHKAEEAILTIPSSVDPLCWALAGLTALKVEDATGQNRTQDARKYFRRCMELGGVLPRRLCEGSDYEPVTSKQETYDENGSGFASDSDSNTDSDQELGPFLGSSAGTVIEGRDDQIHGTMSTPESGNTFDSDTSPEENPSKRLKQKSDDDDDYDDLNDNVEDHVSAIKKEASHNMKAEESSQLPGSTRSHVSRPGSTWTDSESEGDASLGDSVEVKAELKTSASQSQRSLGMSWTDSESEDDT